ncbi:MAG: NUDIX domain-containing protein [Flavisolibacter sp.]
MVLTIYFDDKPLFISPTITPEISGLLQQDQVFTYYHFDHQTIKDAIAKMAQKQTKAVIMVFEDVDALLYGFKKEFVLVVAAGGLIYSSDNKILFIYRRGKWDLPKGKLDPGEALAECAVREVREETGLEQVSVVREIHTSYHTYFEGGQHILKESHWFLMKGDSQEIFNPQLEEDITKCQWIPLTQLKNYLENTHASITDVTQLFLKAIHVEKDYLGE